MQFSAAQLAEAQQTYREMVRSRVDEPVEAAWLFHRSGFLPSYGVSMDFLERLRAPAAA